MSHLHKSGRIFWRLIVLTGLTVLSVIPVQSPASAQDPAGPAWVVRTIHTGEFGLVEAEGLAFSPPTNTFIVLDADGNISPQHYAFLVDDSEFDEILGRIRERKLSYWGDPAQTKASEMLVPTPRAMAPATICNAWPKPLPG